MGERGEEEPSGDSSTESGRASQTGDVFVADPGPAFQPGDAPEPEQPAAELHALPEPAPEWMEDTVRGLLSTKGELLHALVGVADEDWRYTEVDLQAIAPPLTRILNRYPATAAAAAFGDPMLLAVAMSAYGIRSARERSEMLQAIAEEPDQPITGVPAPAGTEPPPGHPAAVVAQERPAEQEGEFDPERVDWQRS